MVVLGWIVLFLAIACVLAFNRATLMVCVIAMAFLLVLVSAFSHLSFFTNIFLWIIFIVLVGIFAILPLRRRLFSFRAMAFYRRSMPTISATEDEVLSAGNVGWEAELFSGMPNWEKFRAIPKGKLSEEERAFLEGPVDKLCSMISDWEINHCLFTIPETIWSYCKKEGFFGLIIPKKYGGKEFSALAHSQIIAKLASVSTAVATVVSVPNSLGPAELLLCYGTEEQRNYYLPHLATGEEIPCFALTSPVAGSDASALVDHGVVCRQRVNNEEIVGIRLNWDKRYITLSPVATLLGLAFKLYDPDHLLGVQENIGITCALIPIPTSGASTGRHHFPLCCAFPNGPTQGKEVFIPIEAIIGGRKMAGHGWRMLMESLAAGRSISLPSMVAGGAKRAMYATGAYARIRQQFNTYIGMFGGVQEALAKIGAYTYLIEATRLFTVMAVDRGEQSAVASAISKCHTTHTNRNLINHAMDIHGGKGICMGPHNYLAQNYIEGPIGITVEGANILTRSMIIFGQGAVRCHPFVLKEMEAVKNDDKKAGLVAFDKAFFAHLGFTISNFVRSFGLAISLGRFSVTPAGELKKYYQKFSRYAASFALIADMAMLTMRGALKRKERLSARLSDILSYLYMGSAVMKYYELENEPEGLPFLQWVCDDLLHQVETRLDEFLFHMPNRYLSWILRICIFPFGKRLPLPNDRLTEKVASYLLYPSNIRACLTKDLYTKNTTYNPIGLIDTVLRKVIEAEPIEKKLHQAVKMGAVKGKTYEETVTHALQGKIINQDEATQLLDTFEYRMQIIHVDDFSSEELHSKFDDRF